MLIGAFSWLRTQRGTKGVVRRVEAEPEAGPSYDPQYDRRRGRGDPLMVDDPVGGGAEVGFTATEDLVITGLEAGVSEGADQIEGEKSRWDHAVVDPSREVKVGFHGRRSKQRS